ncbi:MAG: zf-HC2 domain-containing protein [Lachnospiraceae bacterium]|nr:zf-HC2 domain-containing protein [Lachnospiraceae bacterium]
MGKDKFNECDVVQDLLPLYYDNACTSASKKMVEQHLMTCEKCKKTYEALRNTTIDTVMKNESVGILERHAKKERNMAYKAGIMIALILMVPVVITFIVSMSSGGGLGVFAVLTASMLLVASLSVVPLLSTQRRMTKSILASVIALLLIFFFVDRMNGGGEFVLWTVPTIFGLSIVFFPLVIRNITLPPILSDKKALITLTWDTLWLFLTIFEVCNHSGDIEGMRTGYTVSLILMTGVWLIFLVARYLPVNVWIKAGIILIISCIWMAFTNDVYAYFAEHKKQLTILSTNFSDWSTNICVNANVYTLILIFGGIVGGGLLVYGIINMKRKRLK